MKRELPAEPQVLAARPMRNGPRPMRNRATTLLLASLLILIAACAESAPSPVDPGRALPGKADFEASSTATFVAMSYAATLLPSGDVTGFHEPFLVIGDDGNVFGSTRDGGMGMDERGHDVEPALARRILFEGLATRGQPRWRGRRTDEGGDGRRLAGPRGRVAPALR
jgi:hypothetical protein